MSTNQQDPADRQRQMFGCTIAELEQDFDHAERLGYTRIRYAQAILSDVQELMRTVTESHNGSRADADALRDEKLERARQWVNKAKYLTDTAERKLVSQDVLDLHRQVCVALGTDVNRDDLIGLRVGAMGGYIGVYEELSRAVGAVLTGLLERHRTIERLVEAWEDPACYNGGVLVYDLSERIWAAFRDSMGIDGEVIGAQVLATLTPKGA